ncbi:putative Major facilitator superfamily (MFS) profile domain-containing protein [Seiridium cardinale]|uniref:Major facilitator superfamily (MFS) profile domain-containing protein n=1 Tax=Seiridium cardinale TaxID=138064 RepID=A0ABR2Y4R3_9PEZI
MDSNASTTENDDQGSHQSSVEHNGSSRSNPEADEAQRQQTDDWKISKHQLYIILSLTIINMVVALDASVIVTALNSIISDIGGDTTEGFWIGTSYLLATTVVMPPMASVSEIFGRSNISVLLGGRAVQGLGGGGIWVISLLLLTDIVPLRYRPKWWSVMSLGWALGLVIGPLIGGAIAQHTTWRWVFYLNFPFCAFGLVITPLLLTLKPRTETTREKVGRLDWIGGILFTASLTTFLFALTAGGIQFAWNSATFLVPLVVGFSGLVATGLWEEYGAVEPMLKRSLFHNWSSIITYFGGFVQGLVMYGELYYVPFFALAVNEVSPVRAGVILLPVMLILIPSGAVAGAIVSRFNNYRYVIWVGWFLASLSSGLQILWNDQVSDAVWFVPLVILGVGHGLVLNAQTFACQALAKPGDIAAAAATYGFARQFGTAVGVAVGSTTFQNVMALKLSWQGLPTSIAYNAEGYVSELLQLPNSDPTKQGIVTSYVFGFLGVWQVYLGISGIAFFLSFFIKPSNLDRENESEHKLMASRISITSILGIIALWVAALLECCCGIDAWGWVFRLDYLLSYDNETDVWEWSEQSLESGKGPGERRPLIAKAN